MPSPICTSLKNDIKNVSLTLAQLSANLAQDIHHGSQFQVNDDQAGIAAAQSELAGLHQNWLANGCNVLPSKPVPPAIQLLIVADGMVSFGKNAQNMLDQAFEMTELLKTFAQSTFPFITVTKAHRAAGDPASGVPDAVDFHFVTTPNGNPKFKLSNFDEIWLLGDSGPSQSSGNYSPPIDATEIAALTAFMDGGGGVFATGDHEDLGASLAGGVPRVRRMRKWFIKQPFSVGGQPAKSFLPPGWPEAPTGAEQFGHGDLTRGRYDTLQKDAAGDWWFDNQSDDIPQPLALTLKNGKPHPVMQGSQGPIDKFPDHMHEGEVLDLSAWAKIELGDLTFNGQPYTEFPNAASVKPQIVAHGTVIGGHPTPVQPFENNFHTGALAKTVKTFQIGTICVYDGHQAQVGRVAVDSSWHHLFDINLIGDPVAVTDLKKLKGFNDPNNPAALAVLGGMHDYYRNLAMWLARSTTQGDALATITWLMVHRPPFNELLTSPNSATPAAAVIELGALARRVLPPTVSAGTVHEAIVGVVRGTPLELAYVSQWADDGRAVADPDALLNAGLGGLVLAAARAQEGRTSFDVPDREVLRGILHAGIGEGLVALASVARREAEQIAAVAEKLDAVIATKDATATNGSARPAAAAR